MGQGRSETGRRWKPELVPSVAEGGIWPWEQASNLKRGPWPGSRAMRVPPQLRKRSPPQLDQFIEQLRHRLAFHRLHMTKPIKWLKWHRIPMLENDPHPRHPVVVLAVDQVADDVERAPGLLAFVDPRPRIGQIAQQSIESGRSVRKQRKRRFQI